MPTHIAEPVDLTMTLIATATDAEVSVEQARRFLRSLVLLSREQQDALLNEARRECIRDLSAKARRRRT